MTQPDPDLRDRIAKTLRPHASLGGAPSRWQMPFFDGATPSLPRISGWRDLDDVADAVLAVLPTGQRAVVLSDTERQFLTYALDLAADQMASPRGVVFTDEDNAAMERLRRLAGEAQQDEAVQP